MDGKISQSHFYITPGRQFAKEIKKGVQEEISQRTYTGRSSLHYELQELGIEIEGSYPNYCPSGGVGGKWLLSHQYQVAPWACEIIPMTIVFVSYLYSFRENEL